jgi:outer membrane protein OmpA-like peptidoglycan-associated protein
MKFYTFNKAKQIVGLIVLLLSLASSLNAFEYILEKTFLQDKQLVKNELLLKELHTQKVKNPLESALKSAHPNQETLEISVEKKKNNIALNTVKFYLNVLKNNEIYQLYFDQNNEFIKLYNEKIKNNLSNFDATTIKAIKDDMATKKANLATQKYNLESSISSFERFTKVKYKETSLVENISQIITPATAQEAEEKFFHAPKNLQKSILETYMVQNIKTPIQEYYKENSHFQGTMKELQNELTKRNTKKTGDNIITHIADIEQLTTLKKKIIETKYNLLFQKCKISFITGTIIKDVKNHEPSQPPMVKESTKPHTVNTQTDDISKIKLKRIHFVSNDDQVSSYSIKIVAKYAAILKGLKDYTLELYGHSDLNHGTISNQDLSLKRAENTKKELVKFGVDGTNIKVFGMGDKYPIASNETKHGRLMNRRVDFKLIKKEDKQ